MTIDPTKPLLDQLIENVGEPKSETRRMAEQLAAYRPRSSSKRRRRFEDDRLSGSAQAL